MIPGLVFNHFNYLTMYIYIYIWLALYSEFTVFTTYNYQFQGIQN